MNTVVKAVNVILSRGLNYRQLRRLLLEAEHQCVDIMCFCNVCWLSRGAMLVYALRNEIATFLENKT